MDPESLRSITWHNYHVGIELMFSVSSWFTCRSRMLVLTFKHLYSVACLLAEIAMPGPLHLSQGKFLDEVAQATSSCSLGRGVQVQAERAAWDFCSQNSIDLVTINPTYVLGPVTSSRVDAQSVKNFIVRAHLPASLSLPPIQTLSLMLIKYANKDNLLLFLSSLASLSSDLLPPPHCNAEAGISSACSGCHSCLKHRCP